MSDCVTASPRIYCELVPNTACWTWTPANRVQPRPGLPMPPPQNLHPSKDNSPPPKQNPSLFKERTAAQTHPQKPQHPASFVEQVDITSTFGSHSRRQFVNLIRYAYASRGPICRSGKQKEKFGQLTNIAQSTDLLWQLESRLPTMR